MENKRFILLVAILSFGYTDFAVGQQSAQATMMITAEVIKGGSALADLRTVLQINESGISGSLGSISLSDDDHVITMQDELSLENMGGDKILLPLSVQSTRRGQQVDIQIHTDTDGKGAGISRGVYSGSLTTTIAYM